MTTVRPEGIYDTKTDRHTSIQTETGTYIHSFHICFCDFISRLLLHCLPPLLLLLLPVVVFSCLLSTVALKFLCFLPSFSSFFTFFFLSFLFLMPWQSYFLSSYYFLYSLVFLLIPTSSLIFFSSFLLQWLILFLFFLLSPHLTHMIMFRSSSFTFPSVFLQ